MKSLRSALSLGLIAPLFAACGAPQLPNAASGAPPSTRVERSSVPGHHTFHFTGAKQVFTVPAGVTRIKVIALGGNGGGQGEQWIGYGGRVDATIRVHPQEVLAVYVGGDGGYTFNGAGLGGSSKSCQCGGYAGGGASDVRVVPAGLSDRILVAGGGGGQGGAAGGGTGGKGGDAVAGRGITGAGGYCGGLGGGPATQRNGGKGAEGGDCYDSGAGAGTPGAIGIGGSGGEGTSGGGGGGAGGGYYGGGGGGGGSGYYPYTYGGGGGGGGGSSYVAKGATNVRFWKGWKAGQHGLVVFDW